jgi:hypothetical protein
MPSPARILETGIGFGKKKQAAIGTANVVGDLWSFWKLNPELSGVVLNTEDDAAEIGKGHEFATEVFPVSWDGNFKLQKYTSSEFAAWAFAFAMGNVVKSGTTPNWIYTISPFSPNAGDPVELPYFSFVEQVRTTPNSLIDRMLVGCQVEGFTLQVNSGPGRQSSQLTVDVVGSGKLTEPSALVIPARTAEHLLLGASMAFNVHAADYVALKNIISATFTWKNNIDLAAGFYPGSGFQTGGDSTTGAIRGRLEYGVRAIGLSYVVRLKSDSTEWAALKAGTSFTDVALSLSAGANDSLAITFPKAKFKVVNFAESGGWIAANCTLDPLYNAGIVGVVAHCTTTDICQ